MAISSGEPAESEGEQGARSIVEAAFRADHGRIVAILTRDLGDLGLAEDALQDAFVEALRSWPSGGVPSAPTAWIITTARNRAIDRLRRANVGEAKLRQLPPAAAGGSESGVDPVFDALMVDADIPDERLTLIFTCCHPALARSDAVALTLRSVAGLTLPELASAFLVKESTMAARLTRAKAKVAKARIPYRVPEHHELPDRLGTVIDVVSLIYNQGYTPASHEAVIDTVRSEAVKVLRSSPLICPTSRRPSRCWHCCCCTRSVAPVGSTPTASWCASMSRTAPVGTPSSSNRPSPCWIGRPGSGPPDAASFKP